MRKTYKIEKSISKKLIRKAVLNANEGGWEICGILMRSENILIPVEVKNVSKKPGSFSYNNKEVRDKVKAIKIINMEVVGMYHSHPVSFAVPGPSDIENAVDDSLMLIIDCMGEKARLWRIKNNRAREINYIDA